MKTLVGYKRKEDDENTTTHNPPIEPSLKRICVAPSEEDFSDTDSDPDCLCDGDCNCNYQPKILFPFLKECGKAKMPTANECNKYDREIFISQGFDVKWSRLHEFSFGNIGPVDPGYISSSADKYRRYMSLAAEKAKSDGLFGDDDGQYLTDFRMLKANHRSMGTMFHRYITFIAKGSVDGVFRCYQAKVTDHRFKVSMESIEFVWLKDERGTVEDIKHIEASKGLNLDRLYMNAFCAIQPVSRAEMTSEVYNPLMEEAARSYKDWTGQELSDLQIVKSEEQFLDLTIRYFISFTAKSLDGGQRRWYRAKVTKTFGSDTCIVESVCLKDRGDQWGVKFWKEIEARKGFDVEDISRRISDIKMMNGGIRSVDASKMNDKHDDYKLFMGIAAEKYHEDCKEKLDDLQIFRANEQFLGRAEHHYITFTARCSSDGKVRCYQAKVTRIYNDSEDDSEDDCEDNEPNSEDDQPDSEDDSEDVCEDESDTESESEPEPVSEPVAEPVAEPESEADSEPEPKPKPKWEDMVEFVSLKHGDGPRYRQQIEANEEGAIKALSAEEIKIKHEEYMHLMRIAAEKAYYKDWGSQVLKDMQMVTAKQQLFGLSVSHYITFTANGSLDGKIRYFEAKVTHTEDDPTPKYTTEYCLCG